MFWRGYGRINRPTYFAGLGIVVLVWAAAIGFEVKIPGEAIALLVAIPRLHDIGRSGWWAGAVLLAELIVVFGGMGIAGREGIELWSQLAILGIVILYWGLLIWLCCLRGQPFTNSYGEPPLPGISFKTYRMPKTPAQPSEQA